MSRRNQSEEKIVLNSAVRPEPYSPLYRLSAVEFTRVWEQHYRSATPTTSTWFIPLNYVDVVWGKCNHVDVVSIRRGIVTNHVDVL